MDRGDYSEDSPIHSRLFVVCERRTTEDTLRQAFSKFGKIEDIRMPRDRNTGESRGVAYVKFSKTSEAAEALEALHRTVLEGGIRPVKVMVAANRSEAQMDEKEGDSKYKRLFINVPTSATENDIEEVFKEFGYIRTTVIQRDRQSGDSRGFAYVTFDKFSEAANAFENCDRQYRALFAAPKTRRQETSFESRIDYIAKSYSSASSAVSLLDDRMGHSRFTSVAFICSPYLNQGLVERLFDIIPGLVNFRFYVDLVRNIGKGTVKYSNPKSAAYAVEKLNEFEYPPGMAVFVKPDNSKFNSMEESSITNKVPSTVTKLKNAIEFSASSSSPDLAELAKAIAEASLLIKKATGGGLSDDINASSEDLNYCSVQLPPSKPLADIDSKVAKRCFLVCKPSPPPLAALRDVFCRFGDLINVYTLPNKTVGYARYASVSAADEAINTLHGAEICGVRIKVLEADEETNPKKRRTLKTDGQNGKDRLCRKKELIAQSAYHEIPNGSIV